jgi:hypothetical protein
VLLYKNIGMVFPEMLYYKQQSILISSYLRLAKLQPALDIAGSLLGGVKCKFDLKNNWDALSESTKSQLLGRTMPWRSNSANRKGASKPRKGGGGGGGLVGNRGSL